MSKLFLLRHGQSVWNLANKFTGWVDIPLSEYGREEALKAGQELQNVLVDEVFTSDLIRAQETALLVMSLQKLDIAPLQRIPVASPADQVDDVRPMWVDKRLNERLYGDLQGVNKQEMIDAYGPEQVHLWRRSYDVRPPGGESLKDTAERTLSCFKELILPKLKLGKTILVVAHGNSLRSLIMSIEKIDASMIDTVECATGQLLGYGYNNSLFSNL